MTCSESGSLSSGEISKVNSTERMLWFAGSAACHVILHPLSDLAIGLSPSKTITDHIIQMSGRLPYLLNYYCHSIVEWAVKHQCDKITMDDISLIEEGEFSLNVIGPLFELDPDTQCIAMQILSSAASSFTIPHVQGMAKALGQSTELSHISRVCNELRTQNIVLWKSGRYWIANEAMRRFAREAGLVGCEVYQC